MSNTIRVQFKKSTDSTKALLGHSYISLQGSLPGEALLHLKQLSLFAMICRLPNDPLHTHALYVLSTVAPYARSWFQQIQDLCLQYRLPHPIKLLENPPTKETFKKLSKLNVTEDWQDILHQEAYQLPSLHYFRLAFHPLQTPHTVWSSTGSMKLPKVMSCRA